MLAIRARLALTLAALLGTSPALAARHLDHTVEIRREGSLQRLLVTRSLMGEGTYAESISLALPLPNEAVVLRLEVERDGRWSPAVLRTSDEARRRFAYLKRRGSRDPAPTVFATLGHAWLNFEAFPVMPGEVLRFRYELLAPRAFTDGAWVLTPAFRQFEPYFPDEPDAPLFVEPVEWGSAAEVKFGSPEREPITDVSLMVAAAELPDGMKLVRTQIAVPAELQPLPVAPRIVFVLDASWSQDFAGLATQRSAIAKCLGSVPDAEVEMIVARRFPQRLFGTFRPAGEALERLSAKPAVMPGNGSDLVAAVTLAASLGGDLKRPFRIIAFSDGMLPLRLREAKLAASGAPAPILIGVVPTEGLPAVRQWFAASEAVDRLLPLIDQIEGDVVTLSLRDPTTLRHLLSPQWITEPELRLAEGAQRLSAPLKQLRSGESWISFTRWPALGTQLDFTGRVWNRPRSWRATRSPEDDAAFEVLAANAPPIARLTDAERESLARQRGVLAPGTALLAEPAEADRTRVGGSLGGRTVRRGGRIALAGIREPAFGHRTAPGPGGAGRWLEERVADAVAGCPGTGADVKVVLETTLTEIVEVQLEHDDLCIEDAIWNLRLDPRFTAEHARHVLTLPRR